MNTHMGFSASRNFFVISILALSAFFFFAGFLPAHAATLTTDKADYFPGETITIYGNFFESLQNMLLSIVGIAEDGSTATSDSWSVTADDIGSFTTTYALPDFYVPFYFLAANSETGEVLVETSFTDSKPLSVSIGGQAPSPIIAGSSAAYVVTVNFDGNGSSCLANITTSGLPSGAALSGTPSVTGPGGVASASTTITITTTGATVPGAYSFTVTASPSSCQGGAAAKSATTTLSVAPAMLDQAILVTTPAPASGIYGNTFPVAATASSGLPVAITTSGSCSGSGSGSATITMTSGTGTCTVHYNQAGNGSYNPAPEITSGTTATKRGVAANITADDKVYDATTFANVSACTLAGQVEGDDVSCISPDGNFLNKNVGDEKTVLVLSGITLGGTNAPNYELVSDGDADTADITPYTGLLATATADDKVYDGNRTAIALLSFGNIFDGDVVIPSGYASSTFDTKDVGINKTVTVTGITGAGTDIGNYTWNTSDTDFANISKADATCTITPYSVTYDASSHTATGSCVGVEDEELEGLNLSGTTHTNAGDYPTDPWTFTDVTGNYNDTSGTVHDVIEKADAVCTIVGDSDTYDSAAHGASGSCVGVGGDGELAGLDLGDSFTDVPGGTANWTFTDVTGNYNNDSDSVPIEILALSLTGSFTADNKTYDGNTGATVLTRSLSGVIGLDDVMLIGGTATFDDANAGIGKTVTLTGATLDGSDAGNYTLGLVSPTTADITPATLTVTADDKVIIAGATDPTFTFHYGGFVNGEATTTAGIITHPTCTVVPSHTSGGIYPITCSGGVANNYDFSYVDGDLVVIGTQPPITITKKEFQKGSTIPVKIPSTIDSWNVRLEVCKGVVHDTTCRDAVSSGGSNDGNMFRYDPIGDKYIYNLSTKLSPTFTTIGTYSLWITINGIVDIPFKLAEIVIK